MNTPKHLLAGLAFALALTPGALAQVHKSIILRDGWQFSKDGGPLQTVTLPHDWAISGEFDRNIDLWKSKRWVNGKEETHESAGNTGCLPWPGKGEYRTKFRVPRPYTHAELLFDGAMAEPEVYVNGQLAGRWACGYNAFRVDATPYLRSGDNVLEVKLNNVELSSRWYPGGGLYRPVKLILSGESAIDTWGVSITTPEVSKSKATVQAQVALREGSADGLEAQLEVLDAGERQLHRAGDNSREVVLAIRSRWTGQPCGRPKVPASTLWLPVCWAAERSSTRTAPDSACAV